MISDSLENLAKQIKNKEKERKTAQKSSVLRKQESQRNTQLKEAQGMPALELSYNELLFFVNETGASEAQGRRNYMEDRYVCFPRLSQPVPVTVEDELSNLFSKVSYFGIYDGHGGARAAQYLTEHLHLDICNSGMC